jgi:hypothetical protein
VICHHIVCYQDHHLTLGLGCSKYSIDLRINLFQSFFYHCIAAEKKKERKKEKKRKEKKGKKRRKKGRK